MNHFYPSIAMTAEVRKKNVEAYWLEFSKWLRPWLKELTARYLERGVFPTFACWLLPSYYTERDDQEVAAMVAMLVRDDAIDGKCLTESDRLVESRCRELRVAMGSSPWRWFKNREFVTRSYGKGSTTLTGGITGSRLAQVMDRLWEGRRREGRWILENAGVKDVRQRLARLVLGTQDGIGVGVWDNMPQDVRCPLTADVRRLMADFFPDWRRILDEDEIIRLFGLERDVDFFYASLAWKDLQRRKPKECSRMVTIYQKRYKDGKQTTSRDIYPELMENFWK